MIPEPGRHLFNNLRAVEFPDIRSTPFLLFFLVLTNVRFRKDLAPLIYGGFGSLAALGSHFSLMSGFERKADVIVLRLSTENNIEFRGNATAVHCTERTC